MSRRWYRLTLLAACAAWSVAAAAADLQALIDAAPAGSTLRIPAGSYRGPLRIAKPLTIEGGGQALVQGDGNSTVISIAGQGVTLRGMRIQGSGDSHDRVDAGILVEGASHRIEDNRIEDVLFGLHLKQATAVVVRNNDVVGKDLSLGMRGDAIRVWLSSSNRIEDNRFRRGRDITFINSGDNAITGNRYLDGRYGLHVVFSPRLRIERNFLSDMGTGIVVLYSRDVALRANRIEHALTGGGAGVVFKDSAKGVVEDNEVLHCAVGIKLDAPPDPSGALLVRGNRFAHNLIGLFFYGEAGGHLFTGNRMENNLTAVAISGQGAGSGNVWRDNYWDDYAGFDRNGDGIGDTPHEVWLFADRIWMETPLANFFRSSPVLELLDLLERLAPFSSPYLVLRDDKPRMK